MASLENLRQNEPRTVGQDRRDGRSAAYTLVGRLRVGRLGNVYLGRRPDGERVEVTLVDERLAWDAAMLSILADDIGDLRTIRRHPLVARPIDADLKSRRPWIATRFVPGPTLRDAVTGHGRLDDGASEVLLTRLAEAVSHLHAEGQVHRGLDPDTVVLTLDGPVVTGLGGARALDSFEATVPVRHDDATAYRPQETVRGLEAGMPGDVFGLGALTVFAATGHGPFGTGSSTEVMRRVMRGEPDLDEVPERLVALLAACLHPEPGRRPTVAALQAQLPRATTGTYSPAMTAAIRGWERQGLGRGSGGRAAAFGTGSGPFGPASTEDLEPTTPTLSAGRTLPLDTANPVDTASFDVHDTGPVAPEDPTAPLSHEATPPRDASSRGASLTQESPPTTRRPESMPVPLPPTVPPDLPTASTPPMSIAPSRPDSPVGTGRWIRIAITAGALVAAAGIGAVLATVLIP